MLEAREEVEAIDWEVLDSASQRSCRSWMMRRKLASFVLIFSESCIAHRSVEGRSEERGMRYFLYGDDGFFGDVVIERVTIR